MCDLVERISLPFNYIGTSSKLKTRRTFTD